MEETRAFKKDIEMTDRQVNDREIRARLRRQWKFLHRRRNRIMHKPGHVCDRLAATSGAVPTRKECTLMLLWMCTVAGAIVGGNYMSQEGWFWLTVGCYVWHIIWDRTKER